jgi:hypothetical protein
MSGITANNIKIYYDDGTPIDPTTGKSLNTSDDRVAEVGTCPVGGSFTPNTSYHPYNQPSVTQSTILEGDRLYVDITVNVHFLTPLISTFAPQGIQFHLQAARTIYPGGLPISTSS